MSCDPSELLILIKLKVKWRLSFGDMTVIFVTFVTYHVTFECFAGEFIYDAKRTLRLMINLKVIFILNKNFRMIHFINIHATCARKIFRIFRENISKEIVQEETIKSC